MAVPRIHWFWAASDRAGGGVEQGAWMTRGWERTKDEMRKTSILLTLIFIFKAVYSRFYYDIFIRVHKVSWWYALPVSLVTPLFLLIPTLPNLPLPPTARSIHTLPVTTSLSKMSFSPVSCYSQWLPCGSTWAYNETEWGAERFRDLSKAAQVSSVWGERCESGNLTSEFEIVALLCAGMGHHVPSAETMPMPFQRESREAGNAGKANHLGIQLLAWPGISELANS